jgi:hypothetical protein
MNVKIHTNQFITRDTKRGQREEKERERERER